MPEDLQEGARIHDSDAPKRAEALQLGVTCHEVVGTTTDRGCQYRIVLRMRSDTGDDLGQGDNGRSLTKEPQVIRSLLRTQVSGKERLLECRR